MPAAGTNLAEMVRKYICCCKADRSSTDYERLVTGGVQSDEYIVTNSNGGPPFAANSRPRLPDSGATSQSRSREEEEEDLMNKILDRTQQSIIDVTNLENNSLDFDMVQRSRLYSEAVRRHDASSSERRRGLLMSDGSTEADSAAQTAAQSSALLDNVGTRATELLAQPGARVDPDELALLAHAADLFLDAHRLGAQIECKDELIVYMSWDE